MHFKQITADEFDLYRPFFRHQKYELCIYSLTAIVAWTTEEYQPYGAIDANTLVLYAEYPQAKADRHLVLPVSPDNEYTPKQLYELAKKMEITSVWFVTEDYRKKHLLEIKKYFTINEQKEYKDYVYLTEDLAQLRGNKFAKKRNLINQFLST